jgi:hypothetical protein
VLDKEAFDLLLPRLTPRMVFLEIGARGCELSLLVAGYVERVWCVESQAAPERAPCNLRRGSLGGVPVESVDLAFSERLEHAADVRALLKKSGLWLLYGTVIRAQALRTAGFSRVAHYAAGLRLPPALARICRTPVTVAYK